MIKELINKIKMTSFCKVSPPMGLPAINNYSLPAEIKEFYSLCGGLVLFENSYFPFEVVPPNKFVSSNKRILGEVFEDDISKDWFIIAESSNSDDFFISIDLNEKRKNLYYDSFYERHGIVGEMPIIATSLSSLLENLLKSQGNYIYWDTDKFEYLGDAYDEK